MPMQYIYSGTKRSALLATERQSEAPTSKHQTSRRTNEHEEKGAIVQQRISFFELPGELRNLIYSYIAADDIILAVSNRNAPSLCSLIPLSSTNKTVREEYFSCLDSQAPQPHAIVHDFDFDHIIAYFDQLAEDAVVDQPHSERDLVIHFAFSPDYSSDPSELIEGSWLEYWSDNRNAQNFRLTHAVSKKVKAEWKNCQEWLERGRGAFWWIKERGQRDVLRGIVMAFCGKGFGVVWR